MVVCWLIGADDEVTLFVNVWLVWVGLVVCNKDEVSDGKRENSSKECVDVQRSTDCQREIAQPVKG